MQRILIILILNLVSGAVVCQKLPEIVTDRPDQTESPVTVYKQRLQIETGFLYEQSSPDEQSFAYPTKLWKYGISRNTELRLITEFDEFRTREETVSGLTPITIGFKTKLAEEKGLLPDISFIGHLSLPFFASRKLKSIYYAPSFRFTLQHTLSETISLGYNVGAEWDGLGPEPTFIFTLTTGFGLTEKLGAFTELYGFAPQKAKADHRFDGGLTYLLNNDMLIDISGGIGLTKNAPDYFISTGFSFRFHP